MFLADDKKAKKFSLAPIEVESFLFVREDIAYKGQLHQINLKIYAPKTISGFIFE
jgi:hypothetical protein